MKKIYILIGLIVVYSVFAVAMNNKNSKEVFEGKWNVKVVGAPQGYQDYVLEIKEDRGEYKVDILFADSRFRIQNRPLALKDGRLTGNIDVDGERVEIAIWEDKGVVQGTARNSYFGTMRMTFARPKD